MKKVFLYIFLLVVMFTIVGCGKTVTNESENETKTLVGYVVIKDNDLYFDEVEIWT